MQICQLRNASLKHFQALGSTFLGHPTRFVANPVALGVTDWTINEKQHWLLTGRNGEGKTLLAKALGRRCQILKLDPTESSFGLFETKPFEVATLSVEKENLMLDRMNIIQERGSFNRFTVNDTTVNSLLNYADFLLNSKEKVAEPAKVRSRISLLESLEMAELLDSYVFHLSTGELRKLLLCFTLSNLILPPKQCLLVLDEVYDGIDLRSKAQITALLKRVSVEADNLNIIVISHRVEGIVSTDFFTNYGLVDQGKFIEVDSSTIQSLDHCRKENSHKLIKGKRQEFNIVCSSVSPLIQVTDWSLKSGDYTSISFSLSRGGSLTIVGPNGCGKSTLLALIAGHNVAGYNIDNICIHGQSLRNFRTDIDKDVEFSFVSYKHQLSTFNSIKSHTPFLKVSEFWGSNCIEEAKELMEVLGIPISFKGKLCARLSQGEQRKTYLVRELLRSFDNVQTSEKPVVLVLDEPYHGLDSTSRAGLLLFLESIVTAKNCTLILVTHNEDEIPSNCNSIVVVEKR